MIYTSAIYANPERTRVTGTDASGNTETVPADHKLFRQPEHGPAGFVANGGVIGEYVSSPSLEPDPETILREAMFEDFVERSAKNASTPKAIKDAALAFKAQRK